MDLGIDKAKLRQYKADITRMLSDPAKMRLAIVFVVAGLAVGAIYMPLSGQIDEAKLVASAEQKREDAIQGVETLWNEANTYRPRIVENRDTNDWVQYLLAGSRRIPVRLRDMQSREPVKVGPYKAIIFTLEVEGTFTQLKQFAEWLEQSDRLLRIDNLRLERQPNSLMMRINLLGLVRKSA